MVKEQANVILEKSGIKSTPNRVLVLDAIIAADSPVGLTELEDRLQTLERSSVLRVLNLLLTSNVVHAMEDGRGITKYEVCSDCGIHSLNHLHIHFYCEKCCRTFCFENHLIPAVELPEGFEVSSANFMYKGLCPECKS